MSTDGRHLEALVAYVEKTLLPEGFAVTTNQRIFNDDGVQIAEFDIEVRGKVGSTSIAWLIECRDRPTSGPAPGAWIEQLVGRRTRFGFNKVTAVSTTGFAAGATEFAMSQGIELREVRALEPEAFASWLPIKYMTNVVRHSTLANATILVDAAEPAERQAALAEVLPRLAAQEPLLRSSLTGEKTTAPYAFSGAVSSVEGAFDGLDPNGEPRTIHLQANYTDDDHFFIDTSSGPIKVRAIVFEGELRIKETKIPIIHRAEYRRTESGETISEVASFAPQSFHGLKFTTEIHRLAETGESYVLLRRVGDDA